MEISLPDDAEKQSVAAGYASVEQYIPASFVVIASDWRLRKASTR
jgi:hypothetical protein